MTIADEVLEHISGELPALAELGEPLDRSRNGRLLAVSTRVTDAGEN
jgi:hypothetical protein